MIKGFRAFLPRLMRPMPLIIFVLTLMLGARIWDVATRVSEDGTLITPTFAEATPEKTMAEKEGMKDAAKADGKKMPEVEDPKLAGEGTGPANPTISEDTLTPTQIQLLQRLAERRKELEGREQSLNDREALLQVTEKRVSEQITELQRLQKQLEQLLLTAQNEQQGQLDSMVKIYETMKPKDAAKIFEALDMPVLLGVVARMKEAKAAPIMAAMDPAKAKEVTTALLRKKELSVNNN